MYKIGQFAKLIGVSIRTLRDWDKKHIKTDRDYNASLNLKYLGLTGEFTA